MLSANKKLILEMIQNIPDPITKNDFFNKLISQNIKSKQVKQIPYTTLVFNMQQVYDRLQSSPKTLSTNEELSK